MTYPIEMSQNFPLETELMWNAEQNIAITHFLLSRSIQPTGSPWVQVGTLIPNLPGGTLQTRAQMVNGGTNAGRPNKIVHKVPKDPDYTWYYKIQRVLKNGTVFPADATMADIVPRTILSFEETHDYFGVQGPSRTTEHKYVKVEIPDGSLFSGAPFVFDFLLRHGRPAFRLRFRGEAADLLMRTNNIQNTSVPIPAWVDEYTWATLYDESYGGVWLTRIIIENDTGGDLDLEIDYSHGVQ